MTLPEEPVVVHVASARINLTAPARPDGYRPIADTLVTFAMIGGRPPERQASWLINAAQKCDSAHLQFQRLRVALSEIEVRIGQPGGASPPVRRRIHEAIGDAQLAITALHGTISLVQRLREAGLRAKMPRNVTRLERKVRALRNVYEHPWQALKEAAAAEAAGSQGLEALKFDLLFRRRRLRGPGGDPTLGVDEEATKVLIEIRDYLVSTWKSAMVVSPGGP